MGGKELEEADVVIRFHDGSVMLGVQGDAGTGRNRSVTLLTIQLERHDDVPHIGRRSTEWRRRTAAGGKHRPPTARGQTRSFDRFETAVRSGALRRKAARALRGLHGYARAFG